MSELTEVLAAIRENANTSARLLAAAEAIKATQLAAAAPRPSGGGSAIININAGGWATIIACAVAVGCMLLQVRGAFAQASIDTAQSADLRELRSENLRLNDYLSALYRQYPELRPENLNKEKP